MIRWEFDNEIVPGLADLLILILARTVPVDSIGLWNDLNDQATMIRLLARCHAEACRIWRHYREAGQ